MSKSQVYRLLTALLLGLTIFLSGAAMFGQKDKKDKKSKNGTEAMPDAPAVLWREPNDITSRDLFLGPGGEARPDLSHLTFLRVDVGGHTKKWRVRDAAGNEWVVKFGNEAQPETFRSALAALAPNISCLTLGTA